MGGMSCFPIPWTPPEREDERFRKLWRGLDRIFAGLLAWGRSRTGIDYEDEAG
jgi:hypothetical protein